MTNINNYKDYYRILGVTRKATEKEIVSQYKKLALKYHPDKGGHALLFSAISEARDVLSDKYSRNNYDRAKVSNNESATNALISELNKGDTNINKINNYLTQGANLDEAFKHSVKLQKVSFVMTFISYGANYKLIDNKFLKNTLKNNKVSVEEKILLLEVSPLLGLLDLKSIDFHSLLKEANLAPNFVHVSKNSILILKLKNGKVFKEEFNLSKIKAGIGSSPFVLAKNDGNFKALKAIIENGEDPNAMDPATKTTALMFAAGSGKSDIVKLLLDKGASVHHVNHAGKTALLNAHEQNNQDIIKMLLKAGAKSNLVDESKNSIVTYKLDGDKVQSQEFKLSKVKAKITDSAFVMAKNDGNFKALKAIIENGEDPNVMDPATKTTALTFAAGSGQSDIVKLLLEKGASVHHVNHAGKTAFLNAHEQNNQDIIKMLLKAGAKSNLIDESKNSIVTYKLDGDKVQSQEFKLSKVKAKITDSAFVLAKNDGNFKALKAIIENGEDPNVMDPATKTTALMFAAGSGQSDIVKLLLERGASVHHVNHAGKTAFLNAQAYPLIEKMILATGGANIVGASKTTNLRSFESNPRKFILEHNTEVDMAINAFGKYHELKGSSSKISDDDFDTTTNCLDHLDHSADYNNLNELCGEFGKYTHTEF